MINQYYLLKIIITLILFFSHPVTVFASQYTCTIKGVLTLNEAGQIVSDKMSNNYMNRKIFIDRETGKVVSTTVLKARFRNFDKTHSPVVLYNAKDRNSYKAVTIFEDKGQFTSIQINENIASDEKPYTYQTTTGILLNGTCVEGVPKN